MRRYSVGVWIFLILTATLAVHAQSIFASLTGTISDANGAVIPKASVVALNEATGLVRKVATDDRGDYLLTQLPIGRYTVSVEVSGFRKEVRSGIVLQLDQKAREDFKLQIGEVQQTVEVQAAAPVVDSETSTIGQVVNNRQVEELPLNGRDFTQLAILAPGVTPAVPGSAYGLRGGFEAGGSRDGTTGFTLDGVDNNDQGYNYLTVKPSLDSIQEFKIQTTYSAEGGRYSGAQVSVTTKSGSNGLHGSAFEFLRNSAMDAKNFFDSPTAKIPSYNRNQYGGSLGGPIIRNKTFFFASWEGLRLRQGLTFLASVPPYEKAFASGDFSALLNPNDPYTKVLSRTPIQLVDPLTRTPFAGNQIPISRLDPIGLKVLQLYPAPNLPSVTSNLLSNPKFSEDNDTYSVRVDHAWNSKLQSFARYSIQNDNFVDPKNIPVTPTFLPGYGGVDDARYQSVTLSTTYVLRPNMVHETRLGFNRFSKIITAQQDGLNGLPAKSDGVSYLGVAGLDPIAHSSFYTGVPYFTITGLDAVGQQIQLPNQRHDTTYQLVDSLSWIRGAHSFKFGVDFERAAVFGMLNGPNRGQFGFNGQYSGNAIADLLLGAPNSTARVVLTGGSDRYYQFHTTGAVYAQDDWTVNRRLTLNLGLRYELDFPQTSGFNQMAAFNPSLGVVQILNITDTRFNPAVTPPAAPLPAALKIQTKPGDSLCDMALGDLAPRFGFAYRPFADSSTVVRGGYGIFYNVDATCGSNGLLWRTTQSFLGTGAGAIPNLSLTNPFPSAAASGAFNPNANIPSLHHTANNQNWNFGIQRQLLRDLVLDVAYYGSKGTHLPLNVNINTATLCPAAVLGSPQAANCGSPSLAVVNSEASRRPYSGLGLVGAVALSEWAGDSSYHALEVRAEQRLRSGLSFTGAYTFSKAIDDISNIQDPYNLRSARGLADIDARHRFVFNAVYALPFGKGRRFGSSIPKALDLALGGWQLSGILTLMTGRPLTPTLAGVDWSYTGGGADRASIVPGQSIASAHPSPNQWFNAAAFTAPPRGTFGDAGRGIITGPGTKNVDLSLQKIFAIREGHNLQLRGEFFNIANHPNFFNPVATQNTPNFGQIVSALPSRQIQVGLRYSF